MDGLHKTRYYTQGCDRLFVGLDHKPLLGFLPGKQLENIDNMRLRRLVEKTYGWSFKVVHIPGRKHAAPDAMSRGVSVNTMERKPTREGLGRGVDASPPLPGRPGSQLDGEMISQLEGEGIPCGDIRSHMLAMLRVVTNEELSQPDSEVDLSGELLASINRAVKSVTWEQVKRSVAKDAEMLELFNWIEGGCLGTKGDLTPKYKYYIMEG